MAPGHNKYRNSADCNTLAGVSYNKLSYCEQPKAKAEKNLYPKPKGLGFTA